jgi:hypothetical protein
VTDGERLVWAASHAHAFVRDSDATGAIRVATQAIALLREAAKLNNTGVDEREFVDEMVNAP